MKENSIEEEIKIALDKFLDNKDKDSAILIVEKFILGNYILRGGRTNIVKDSLRYILSDYKRVLKINEVLLKKNEILKEEKEQAWEEWNNLEQGSYETEQKLKQEIEELIKTYKSEKKMKNEYVKLYQDLLLKENVIPIQRVKDIIDRIDYDIKKTKEIISNNRRDYQRNDYQIVRLKAMNTKSLDIKKRLQKLLESEE